MELHERNIAVNAVSLEVGRPCAPDRVADVIAYLLSEHGHRLTGQVLQVSDPGLPLWVPGRGTGDRGSGQDASVLTSMCHWLDKAGGTRL